jgi:cytochrome P450
VLTLRGVKALNLYVSFLYDPIRTLSRYHSDFGSPVFIEVPLRKRIVVFGVGAEFNRQVLEDPETWHTVSLSRGPRNHATRRLGRGLVGMQGRDHQHYRGLIAPPLRRRAVDAQGEQMARIAASQIDAWPVNQPLDLRMLARRLLQSLAIGLLFGNDHQNGDPIAEMTHGWIEQIWAIKTLCPVNLPGTPYRQLLQHSDDLERRILHWADCKRAKPDANDLFSIVVNNPDENGQRPQDLKLVQHAPTLIGAAYETCHNALIWTLLLLDQHPQVARDLLDELQGRLRGAEPTLDRVVDLPLLDAVVKESMRILPPVPQQFRVALADTTLSGIAVGRRTRAMISAFLTNRDPDLYPAPERFNPGRWAHIDPSPYEYLAFSAGPRICPGSWFGLAVLKVAIAAIMTRYRVAVVPNTRIDTRVRIALGPSGPLPVVLHAQDGAFTPASISGTVAGLFQRTH